MTGRLTERHGGEAGREEGREGDSGKLNLLYASIPTLLYVKYFTPGYLGAYL